MLRELRATAPKVGSPATAVRRSLALSLCTGFPLRCLLLLSVLFALTFATEARANIFDRDAVGMCGERAESTSAPPIIYPAASTEVSGCARSEQKLESDARGILPELNGEAPDASQKPALLSRAIVIPVQTRMIGSVPEPAAHAGTTLHRRLPRPPRRA